MKKIQVLLIGSLILNAALFLIVGVNSKKAAETLSLAAGVSTESAPKPQKKNAELSETLAVPVESRLPVSPQAARFSTAEASSYTVANASISSPALPHKARASSTVSTPSPVASPAPSSSASSGYLTPLPAEGSSAPPLSSPVTISISAGPGNSITYRGQQAAITASRAATDSEPASLDASVTPAAEQSANSSTVQTGNSTGTAFTSNSSMPFDDQLFRTKWGWDAYDQARKAASLAASAAATPGN